MKQWLIPDAFWHSAGGGCFESHEAVCVLNTTNQDAEVTMTLYFEDRDKMDGFYVRVPAERTVHVRLDRLLNKDGNPIPRDTPYAICLTSSEESLTVQYTRVDTSQPELAVATTMIP